MDPRLRRRTSPSTTLLLPALLAAVVSGGCASATPAGPATPPPPAPPPAAWTPDPGAYRIFSGEGRPLELEAALDAMAAAEVVFLGERHDDPVAHHLQDRIFQELHERVGGTRPVVLSLEMFESDVQGVVDEYLAGLITEEHFLRASRPWPNYPGDYRPLVEYARDRGLPVVAANPPRRYVNRVSREGPDSLAELPPAALALLPPLPLSPPSDRYRAAWDALMGGAGQGGTPGQPTPPATAPSPHGTPGHGGPPAQQPPAVSNGLWAQTLWDAGMAHAVAKALDERDGALVLHLAGSFHVDHGTGIPEHLQHYRPATRAFVVVFLPQPPDAPFDAEGHGGLGDVVILTDGTLPRSR